MKLNKRICGWLAFLALPVAQCQADFDGCDNFNDNSIDGAKWAAPVFSSGAALLTETSQRLQFTTTATPTAQDAYALGWWPNTGSYTQDWELKVDANMGMPVFPVASPQPILGLDLVVTPAGTFGPNNYFVIEFGQDIWRWVHCEMATNGGTMVLAQTNSSATNVAIRIVFDSTSKVLSAFADDNTAGCGYSVTPVARAVVPASWGMTTNQFSAGLLGIGHNIAVAPTNNVFFDNFKGAAGSLPGPRITQTGNHVAITWPTNSPACQMESTLTLAPPGCWGQSTNAVATLGTNFIVTNVASSQSKFFRLSRDYGCP